MLLDYSYWCVAYLLDIVGFSRSRWTCLFSSRWALPLLLMLMLRVYTVFEEGYVAGGDM